MESAGTDSFRSDGRWVTTTPSLEMVEMGRILTCSQTPVYLPVRREGSAAVLGVGRRVPAERPSGGDALRAPARALPGAHRGARGRAVAAGRRRGERVLERVLPARRARRRVRLRGRHAARQPGAGPAALLGLRAPA